MGPNLGRRIRPSHSQRVFGTDDAAARTRSAMLVRSRADGLRSSASQEVLARSRTPPAFPTTVGGRDPIDRVEGAGVFDSVGGNETDDLSYSDVSGSASDDGDGSEDGVDEDTPPGTGGSPVGGAGQVEAIPTTKDGVNDSVNDAAMTQGDHGWAETGDNPFLPPEEDSASSERSADGAASDAVFAIPESYGVTTVFIGTDAWSDADDVGDLADLISDGDVSSDGHDDGLL